MKCCFCHKNIKGYGNNALPVKKGRCCEECNQMIVIPERVYRWTKKRGLLKCGEMDTNLKKNSN